MAKGAVQRADTHIVAPSAWRFPERLVGRGTRLLAQQCWYWGCDVRRPEGNLLLEYGFARTRPPCPKVGSTIYTCAPTPGAQIALWSFGVFMGREPFGGLFLDRFRFEPRLLDAPALPPSIWTLEELPATRRPCGAERERTASLLGALIGWIVAYEDAIRDSYGPGYREGCLQQWSRQKLALPANQLVPEWHALIAAIAAELGAIDMHAQGATQRRSAVC